MHWEFPVYAPQPASASLTRSDGPGRTLSYDEAFAFIAGDDPRPLLVLRECRVCNGTDDALLSAGADNEKTLLLSRWFHCVKLPVDVLEDGHPLGELFPGKTTEHLFMSTRDGSVRVPLNSEGSRTELWSSMVRVLTADYAGSPERSLKTVRRAIDQLDVVDERIQQLENRIDDLIEQKGPDSPKLKRVRKQLAKARQERNGLVGKVSRAYDLDLRRPSVAGAGARDAR